MLTTLLSILTNRILWSFLGVTALAAVIWMIGPLLSIVDTRPLESEQNRIISIAVVYLLWAQGHILPRLYNAWLNRKLMDKLNENTTSPEAADPQKRLNSEEQILASRFDEAAQMLKKAHFSKAGQGAQWTQRFSTQYLYQLPWYVIIGAPGSGKTTALVNSGLQFPLADRFGKPRCAALAARATATGGLPTRRCCWTPRAATPPGERAGAGRRGMAGVHGVAAKYRRRQPINGVIVTISISDLLTQSAEAPPAGGEPAPASVRAA
jgi:type VI secretion system protein ImpL